MTAPRSIFDYACAVRPARRPPAAVRVIKPLQERDDSALAQHAEAMRHLWQAVAAATIQDAAHAVAVASDHGEEAKAKEIRHRMTYFRGRDWRMICDFAGIGVRTDKIREELERAKRNAPGNRNSNHSGGPVRLIVWIDGQKFNSAAHAARFIGASSSSLTSRIAAARGRGQQEFRSYGHHIKFERGK
ncbi:hypothetical protein [Ketogulonicigenium vulgare]|uniref:hypothetical protein n=1 Tax=Ketogulonicigenium vulgare TaxID=92945 RepID=UPI002359E962|nr:hypothetical protein [Ketogulonicigenium vulgare]